MIGMVKNIEKILKIENRSEKIKKIVDKNKYNRKESEDREYIEERNRQDRKDIDDREIVKKEKVKNK